jgi:hypothetical protein
VQTEAEIDRVIDEWSAVRVFIGGPSLEMQYPGQERVMIGWWRLLHLLWQWRRGDSLVLFVDEST